MLSDASRELDREKEDRRVNKKQDGGGRNRDREEERRDRGRNSEERLPGWESEEDDKLDRKKRRKKYCLKGWSYTGHSAIIVRDLINLDSLHVTQSRFTGF